jgi:lipopolysaccharide export system permease protein
VAITSVHRTSAATFDFKTDTTTAVKITERIDAASMRYDSVKKIWVLANGVSRNFQDANNIVTTAFEKRELPALPITPDELNLSQQNIGELTIEEFRDRIEQERLSGRDVNRLEVDFYAKFSFPFASVIVVFFGIPFSSRQRKSGAAMQIAITGLVSAIYLVLSEISKAFSYGGALEPIAIAWAVNVLFALVGIANLYRIERG